MTTENLFAASNVTVVTNNRSLAGTVQLTTLSDGVARKIFEEAKLDDELLKRIGRSMTDMSALDSLIKDLGNIADTDYSFLTDIAEDQLDNMLKSQQSKRSRCKSKTMTEDNYLNMMSAAIAESYIRLVTGKSKNSVGRGATGSNVVFTEDRLMELAVDQEALRKEIRNVQSKKSIMKSKAEFSETDERWQMLLTAEAQLKGIRTTGGVQRVQLVDETKETIREMLAEVNIEAIKLPNAKQLLEAIYNVVFATDDEEDNVDDEPVDDTSDTPVE